MCYDGWYLDDDNTGSVVIFPGGDNDDNDDDDDREELPLQMVMVSLQSSSVWDGMGWDGMGWDGGEWRERRGACIPHRKLQFSPFSSAF
jgi:hypothetical protein